MHVFRRAFEAGREDARRLIRGPSSVADRVACLASSPLIHLAAGLCGALAFSFAIGREGNVFFVRLLRRNAGPLLPLFEMVDGPLHAVLKKWNAGPGVLQQYPTEYAAVLLIFVVAATALAWGGSRAAFLVAPALRHRRSQFLSSGIVTQSVRDAGRLYGAWEMFAGGPASLRRKTVVASQYLMVRAAVKMGCDVVRIIVFGWVLTASDYGLHALVMMVITLLDSFSGLGLDIMIQRDDEEVVAERLPVYWTIQFVRGALLFIAAWAVAPWVGRLYAEQLARTRYGAPFFVGLTRFMATIFLLRAGAGFGRELRQRQLDFQRVVVYDILTHGATLVTGLILLFTVRNVLALAGLVYAGALGRFVTSYLLHPWRPRFAWDRRLVREIVVFSSGIVVVTLLNALGGRIDHAVVGKVLGMAALGFYGRAYALATVSSHSFTNIIAPVMLPALKAVAGDPARFRRAFRRSLFVYLTGALVIAAVFGAVSYPVVKYAFGRNGYWLPMLPPFYVLLLFGVSRAVGSLTPSALFVLNRPWFVAASTAVWAGGVALAAWPMTVWYGVVGTAWAVVGASAASNILAVHLVFRCSRRMEQTSSPAESADP